MTLYSNLYPRYLTPTFYLENSLTALIAQCDVVTVNCPLHEGTRGLVNAELLSHIKKGAWLVNTARGAICDKDAVAAALKSGRLRGEFCILHRPF